MKKLLVIILTLSSTITFSQTKEETVAYVNNILNLHNNSTMYHSINVLASSEISADNTIYMQGTNSTTLHFVFNPKEALYINTNIRENGVGSIVIFFKSKSVKFLGADGNPLEYQDRISMEGLVDITPVEMTKIKKALKHLISLLGGQIKEDPF